MRARKAKVIKHTRRVTAPLWAFEVRTSLVASLKKQLQKWVRSLVTSLEGSEQGYGKISSSIPPGAMNVAYP